MANYLASDTALAAVANAIRTKGDTSGMLEFPSGFVTAIGNIPTGSPLPIVTGTFTGATAGTAETVTIPYNGSGYPIAVLICPSVGSNKAGSAIAGLAQKNVIVIYVKTKDDFSTTPTYNGSGSENLGAYYGLVHDSASDATAYAAKGGASGTMFTSNSAGESFGNAVRFNSATSMSVYIANTTWGFAPDIEYTYWIMYSE